MAENRVVSIIVIKTLSGVPSQQVLICLGHSFLLTVIDIGDSANII